MAWISLDNLTRFYTKLKEKVYLKTEIDTKLSSKADTSHTHDDRYYTEDEINTKVSALNTAIANSGKFYGINNDDVLFTYTSNGSGTYTATKNCYAILNLRTSGNSATITLNGATISYHNIVDGLMSCIVPLIKNDVIGWNGSDSWRNHNIRVLGIK